jgi:hypothetical protein
VATKEGVSYDGMAVATIKSDELFFHCVKVENTGNDSFEAGKDFGRQIVQAFEDTGKTEIPGNQTVITLIDGFSKVNGSELLKGAYSILGANYRFAGGGSGDSLKFKETYQFYNDQILNDSVVGALVVSQKKQGINLKHGWIPEGDFMIATRAEGKTLIEIDGKPALEVYMKLRGVDMATFDYTNFYKFAMSYPIGLPIGRGEYAIRDPFVASLENKTITFVSEIPENSIIQLMKGDKVSILEASKEASNEVKNQLGGQKPVISFIFDCISRTIFLDKDIATEIENIGNILGKDTAFICAFSFGEIGTEKGGIPILCNKTCTIYSLS